MIKHDVRRLEVRSKELRTLLRSLVETDWDELIPIWRRPGWTTPAEFTFASVILDTMIKQAELLGSLKGGLLSGSREVVARG